MVCVSLLLFPSVLPSLSIRIHSSLSSIILVLAAVSISLFVLDPFPSSSPVSLLVSLSISCFSSQPNKTIQHVSPLFCIFYFLSFVYFYPVLREFSLSFPI